MDFLRLPFFAALEGAQNILLAGAGGGYDIFCGLPLYFGLKAQGKRVHLANLSFTRIYATNGRQLAPSLVEVTARTQGEADYFPELYLAQWLAQHEEAVPIYCLEQTGVQSLLFAYRYLMETLALDAIVLVDGGTDSLMRGDEAGLGTPEEDMVSVATVHSLEVPTKLLVCLGFGVDAYHGVCHAHFLEAVGAITRAGGFLGAWSLTDSMPETQRYREACNWVFRQMPKGPSIVSASILSAIEGRFGDYHATPRTEGTRLFINALMSLYWCFRLESVAQRLLYLEEMMATTSYLDVAVTIAKFRGRHKPIKEWQTIPL